MNDINRAEALGFLSAYDAAREAGNEAKRAYALAVERIGRQKVEALNGAAAILGTSFKRKGVKVTVVVKTLKSGAVTAYLKGESDTNDLVDIDA